MAWKLTASPTTRKITRKLAEEFCEMESPKHDRPLSERRLVIYERIAGLGGFRPVSWASVMCQETGETYRVNGKHTSTLFSRMDPLPDGLFAVIEHYECDTLEDVARLYGTYDSKLQSRTTNDIYLSFASTVPEFSAIGRRIIACVISGVAFHKWLEGYAAIPAPERAELILDECDFMLAVNTLFEGNNHKHVLRVPVVAAIYGSWKKSQAKAVEFWKAVCEETGPKPDCPDRKIAKWLLTNTVNSGQGAKEGTLPSRRATPREFYVKCIHAWNAWRKGEPTDLKYYKGTKVPSFA